MPAWRGHEEAGLSFIEDPSVHGGPDQQGGARSQTERAAMLLRTDIIDGALMPGLKLKLDMLRERYDIGAAPLREALSRLAGEGLVLAQASVRGLRVRMRREPVQRRVRRPPRQERQHPLGHWLGARGPTQVFQARRVL